MLALVALAAALPALALLLTGALERQEGQTVDARFALRGPVPAPGLAIIDINDESIRRIGRWPIRRSWHARAVDRLRQAGARVIAYDVQFSEASDFPAADRALYRALARAPGRTVLSATEVSRGRHTVFGGEQNLRAIGARGGNTNVPVSAGGVKRRVWYSLDGLKSFAVAAAEAATGRRVDPAGFGRDGALIDFHGPAGTIPTYSFADLVAPGRSHIDPARLRGRVVVIGSSAPSLQDIHTTPTDDLMPGPELQANAISTVLRGLPLRDAPGWLDALATLLFAVAVPLAALRMRAALAALLGAALLGGGLVAAQVLFDRGVVVHVVAPVLGLVLGAVGSLAAAALISLRERRRTRHLFGRFVPEAVVDELLAREDGSGHIGGVRQDATVLFCDLRGFTTFAEDAEPELVIDVLNRYLTECSDAILAEQGTVVSYLGDGIMAVFGSPVERPDHADAALRSARDMLSVRLARLNAWLAERGIAPFALGVGLNSGAVMSGTVGSEQRMEYAAVGDTTNVAARLQAATKGTPHSLFVAQTTWERLGPAGRAALTGAGELALRGRGRGVSIWAPARSAADERDEPHGAGVAALEPAA